MQIECSNCGARQRFSYSAANVNSLIAFGWGSFGSALYCPECTATWHIRNKTKELDSKTSTIAVIDEWAERQEHRERNAGHTPACNMKGR